MITLGIDLGLSSTAIVRYDGESFTTVRGNQRVKPAPKLPGEIADRVSIIMQGINVEGIRVAIDWDERDIFWGNQRLLAQRKAFMAGVLYRCIYDKGGVPLFIPPSIVRSTFGLKKNAKKEEVWKVAAGTMPSAGLLLDEHELDAGVLAYVVSVLDMETITWKSPVSSTSRRTTRSRSRGSSGRTSGSGRGSST